MEYTIIIFFLFCCILHLKLRGPLVEKMHIQLTLFYSRKYLY